MQSKSPVLKCPHASESAGSLDLAKKLSCVAQFLNYLISKETDNPYYQQLKKKSDQGAREMAQQLRALTGFPEVLSSIPSTHIVTHNHL